MNTEQAEQLAAFMVEIPERVSIVNFAHSDPNGSGYLPPSEEHPYWRSPEGDRVTVAEVWGGADEETSRWIFNITLAFLCRTYFDTYTENRWEKNLIFRGADGVTSLMGELQNQLGPRHWATK